MTELATQYGRYGYRRITGMLRWAGWSWRFRPDDFEVLSREGMVGGAYRASEHFVREAKRQNL